jgi:deoxycytidylate deaminase
MMPVREPNPEYNKKEQIKGTKDRIDNTLTEEIVLAICAPIGSLKENVLESIKKRLRDYNYEVQIIKLSDFIESNYETEFAPVPGETETFSRLKHKISGGNHLRSKYGTSILADFAISDIYFDRVNITGGTIKKIDIENVKTRRKCYIIDSIKNIDELLLLRKVYREIFYFFSILSPMEERVKNLLSKNLSQAEVDSIIETDEFENQPNGQRVRDVFVVADFFIRASELSLNDIDKKVERYFHLIFNSEIVTPYSNEIAMYQAKSAAGNSACLSRQVGAAITDNEGEFISVGWNDVPKFGGNLYKEDHIKDSRCKVYGYCSNDITKDGLTENIIEGIFKDPELRTIFKDDLEIGKGSDNYKKLLSVIRKSTKVKDLIEFSRSVHAEMHALIIGSQLSGSKMIGGKLFCTTYPCHNCARHIIVSGIKEIYYIEPYVKSLCIDLHQDAITEDETVTDKVRILLYDGVAPRRYLEFFTMSGERKDKGGNLTKSDLTQIFPKSRLTLQAIPTLEAQTIFTLIGLGLIENQDEQE